jgi:hypothetical protein
MNDYLTKAGYRPIFIGSICYSYLVGEEVETKDVDIAVEGFPHEVSNAWRVVSHIVDYLKEKGYGIIRKGLIDVGFGPIPQILVKVNEHLLGIEIFPKIWGLPIYRYETLRKEEFELLSPESFVLTRLANPRGLSKEDKIWINDVASVCKVNVQKIVELIRLLKFEEIVAKNLKELRKPNKALIPLFKLFKIPCNLLHD